MKLPGPAHGLQSVASCTCLVAQKKRAHDMQLCVHDANKGGQCQFFKHVCFASALPWLPVPVVAVATYR